ncbi:MAG: hypothetical protein JW947_10680 [Sedimentisphaerales bacterium]|nr:hypothetical protein [Sedimentisphaerales bacterium]
MDLEQDQQKKLLDTTDCLEAVSVFRGWKNFLFIIVILCLLLLQMSFWLVHTGCIAAEQQVCSDNKAVAAAVTDSLEPIAETAEVKDENIKKAAEQVAAASDKPAEAEPQKPLKRLPKLNLKAEFKHIAWLISVINFVLIIAATLYCLAILFSLKISLIGRLGGINHISRAFFLSLIFLVLLLPWQIFWQKIFAGEFFGAMFTSSDLLSSFTAYKDSRVLYKVFYYFRFSGYWLIALLLLIFSFSRTCRWAKATLRRLEVI